MSSLLEANVLVVNQKAKLIELTNEYAIRDEDGNDIGFIREEGQSTVKKALRFISSIDQYLTHRYSVYDSAGTKVLEMTRPRKVFKSRVEVKNASGVPAGEIVQQNVFGKIRFDLVGGGGAPVGQIRAENWRAWNFAIVDTNEQEIARITKKFVGVLKAVFTPADNYVVEINESVTPEQRFLVLAAAAGVDTALKQDARGLDVGDITDF